MIHSAINSKFKEAEQIYGMPSFFVRAIVLFPFIVVIVSCLLIIIPQTRSASFWIILSENGPVELTTFVLLVLGGIRGLVLVRLMMRCGEGRFVYGFFALFSIGLLIVGMEEVSWSQTFFGFETPSLIRNINEQEEVTLHNIYFLQGHSECFRLTYGLGGIVGILLCSLRYYPKLGVPMILLPWFLIFVVLAGIDLYNDYYVIHEQFDFLIHMLSEIVEMLIAISGFLYMLLNARAHNSE